MPRKYVKTRIPKTARLPIAGAVGRRKKAVPLEDLEIIYDRIKNGASASQIARERGCTPQNVATLLRANGFPPLPRGSGGVGAEKRIKIPVGRLPHIFARIKAGETSVGIAAEIGVSHGALRNALRRHGYGPLPKSHRMSQLDGK